MTPSDIYGPLCVVSSVVTSYTAGVASTFKIQGRDFYANNIQTLFAATVTDYIIEFRDSSNNTVLSGSISDDISGAGVYQVSFTPQTAGTYYMWL